MSKSKILIVEDEKDISDILCEMLDLFGYSASVITDGIEAWCQISQNEYDLILTDLRLPGIDGIELLTRIRLHNLKTPVMIISGVDLHGRQADLSKLGPLDTIQKPFKMEDLKDRLARLLRLSNNIRQKTKHKNS